MSDLGQLLKKARLERQLSLDDLQESTKIRKRYLEAIEEDDYKVLPGSFYARAFIKSYAEAVGMDPDEVMKMYQNVIPQIKIDPVAEPVRTRRRPVKNMDKVSKWASAILIFFFLLLILILIYIWWYQADKPENEAINPPITDQLAPPDQHEHIGDGGDIEETGKETAPPEVIEEPDPVVEPEVVYVNTDGSTYIYTASHANELHVELSFPTGDCWVQLKENNNNGKDVAIKTYKQGETISFTFETSVWIRFGQPRSAIIKVNGIVLDDEKLKDRNPWNIQLNLVKEHEETAAI